MTVTLVLLILFVIAVTSVILAHDSDKQKAARAQAERDAQRDRHLEWLRRKYSGTNPSNRYCMRNNKDYTGEKPLSPSRLAEVKQSILRETL